MKNPETLREILIEHSRSKSVWTVSPETKARLFKRVSKELFEVSPDLEFPVLKSAMVIGFMLRENKMDQKDFLFEFVNYILGSLVQEDPDKYTLIKNQVLRVLPGLTEYNIRTIDHETATKYYSQIKALYDFAFGDKPKKFQS